jgi:hypothetical protein
MNILGLTLVSSGPLIEAACGHAENLRFSGPAFSQEGTFNGSAPFFNRRQTFPSRFLLCACRPPPCPGVQMEDRLEQRQAPVEVRRATPLGRWYQL